MEKALLRILEDHRETCVDWEAGQSAKALLAETEAARKCQQERPVMWRLNSMWHWYEHEQLTGLIPLLGLTSMKVCHEMQLQKSSSSLWGLAGMTGKFGHSRDHRLTATLMFIY